MTPKSLWWGSYGVGGLLKVLEGGYVSRGVGLEVSLRSWKGDMEVAGGSGGVLKDLEGGYGGGWVVVRGTPKSLWGFLWGWGTL